MMFDDDAPNFDYDSEEENRIAQEMNELDNASKNKSLANFPAINLPNDKTEINNLLSNNGSNKKIKLSETTNSVLSEMNTPQRPHQERNFHYGNKANELVFETPSYLSKRFQDSREFKYLNVLLPSGKDIKLKMHLKEPVMMNNDFDHKSNSFLPKSIQELKLEIASEEEKKLKHSIEEMQSDSFSIEPRDSSKSEVDLWVEKFRPKDYFELLSDDGTNRLILTWMKTWDYFVFGKEVEKDKHDMKNRAASGLTVSKDAPNSSKKRKRLIEDEMAEKLLELDELNRPKLKVALVSGPPGLGKTTLAQIISKRAGYNCIEMNASDDRNPEAFRQYIEAVTQIRGSVNDANMKPNCLILDEIDGAPQNAIQVLIDHISETKKGKGKEVKRCLRPIICICNDLYTPALKQLRQVSIVFQCQAISTHRLAERLRGICTMTKMDAEIDGLIALCDKTSNDIRSCLNTLQFLSRRANKITVKLVAELNVGQKDMEKSIFTIMNEIFFKKFDKKDKLSDEKSKINSIINMCQNCDLDRLIQALYENFLFIRFRDSNFEMVKKANEWMMFTDRLNRQIRQNQEYAFMGYQKYLPVLFHLLFSSTSLQINSQNKKFSYPHTLFDTEMKLSKNRKITTGFLNEMSSSARVYHNSNSHSIMDLLPYLTQILQMNIRPVAIQLLSKNEKERFDALVNLMILFNLNYRQEKTLDGQFGFVLDPPIDELIKLSGMKQHKQLPNMVRQQISREITITRVRLMDKSKASGQNESNNSGSGTSTAANKAKAMFNLKNLDQISKEKESDKAKKTAAASTDKPPLKEKAGLHSFFQRSAADKAKNNDTKVKEENKGRKYNDGVWLKYKEGFINAVKYNIKINQLL